MAHCWTCGLPTADNRYTCHGCESVEELKGVHRAVGVLAATVAAGLGEVGWQVVQLRDEVRQLDEVLRSPGRVAANEARLVAEEARRRGALEDAERFFTKALNEDPLDGRTYIGLGRTYISQRRFSEARQILDRARPHATSKELEVYRLRLTARLAACEGDFGMARTVASKARHQAVVDRDVLCYEEAHYAAQGGDADGAIELLKQAIGSNPGYAELAEREYYLIPIRARMKAEIWSDVDPMAVASSTFNALIPEFRKTSNAARNVGLWQCKKELEQAKKIVEAEQDPGQGPLERGRRLVNGIAAMRRAVNCVKEALNRAEDVVDAPRSEKGYEWAVRRQAVSTAAKWAAVGALAGGVLGLVTNGPTGIPTGILVGGVGGFLIRYFRVV